MILGIDEVGRGAWAGPLVVGAVVLNENTIIRGLTDSKRLTRKQRGIIERQIRISAVAVGLGWVRSKEIDILGLSQALKLASRRAIQHMDHIKYASIIIDGTVAFLDDERVTLMKQADLLIPSVSAASVVAKVARDKYMASLDAIHPGYEFVNHVGYGTLKHRNAIKHFGVSSEHRLSFAPLRRYKQS